MTAVTYNNKMENKKLKNIVYYNKVRITKHNQKISILSQELQDLKILLLSLFLIIIIGIFSLILELNIYN